MKFLRFPVLPGSAEAPVISCGIGAACTTPPSYNRVRAVMWAYGRAQTHRQIDTHTDVRDHNIFCVVYDSRKITAAVC